MSAAVREIDHQADDQPDNQPGPCVRRQVLHQIAAGHDAQRRDEPDCWGTKRTRDLRIGESQHKYARANDRERQQRADGHEWAQQPYWKKSGDGHSCDVDDDLGNPWRSEGRMDHAEHGRQQAFNVLGRPRRDVVNGR